MACARRSGRFGCRIADYQYSRAGNLPWCVDGRAVTGCTLDLQPTTARVVATFDHGSPVPKPAATEHDLGKGTAVVLAYEATLACAAPGHDDDERRLVKALLGSHRPPYRCEALAYRLAAPTADHYFLMNDGNAREVSLETPAYRYAAAEDPVTGEAVALPGPIRLEACSARWLRCRRA